MTWMTDVTPGPGFRQARAAQTSDRSQTANQNHATTQTADTQNSRVRGERGEGMSCGMTQYPPGPRLRQAPACGLSEGER
jgi:hypothetical protein